MLSSYDPLIIINEKLRLISDSYQLTIHQINVLLNELINQTENESEIRKNYCEICFIKNVEFQGHHIGGKYNDYRQITTCLPCHNILTEKQKLDSRIWTEGNPNFLKQSFFVRGLYDILYLMALKRNNTIYAQIADSLLNTIYSLQRSAQN
jgi:hypothetical protein